jgi:hypothetical protein
MSQDGNWDRHRPYTTRKLAISDGNLRRNKFCLKLNIIWDGFETNLIHRLFRPNFVPI